MYWFSRSYVLIDSTIVVSSGFIFPDTSNDPTGQVSAKGGGATV